MVAPYSPRFYPGPSWLKRTNGTRMCGMPETTPADIPAEWARVLAVATAMTGDEARAQHLLRNEKLRAFEGLTAEELVRAGRADDVIGYLHSLAAGSAG